METHPQTWKWPHKRRSACKHYCQQNSASPNSKWKSGTKKINSRIDRRILDSDPVLTSNFSEEELNASIQSTKKGKAAGLDNIFIEEVNHFGPKAKSWLIQFFNNCHSTQIIPKICRKAKVIAFLKPGKDPSLPKKLPSYIPSQPPA